MNELARYDAACNALAAAKSVDEAKDIHDKAEAMRAYARQAKNKELEIDAAEIRLRARRRLGELINAQKDAVGLNRGGRPKSRSDDEQVSEPPTLSDAGIDRKLSSLAQKMAAVPEAEFEGMVGDWRERVGKENERVTTSLLRAGEKQISRNEREAALAEKMRAAAEGLEGDGRFGVIYADPPWRFEPRSRQTGMDRSADNHYPTMTVEDIAAMQAPAADDCVLFLWATAPMLPDALYVLDMWGFAYKSHIVWTKDRPGTGYWSRNRHELLLIGTRGNIPAPEPGTQPDSVIAAPVGPHSAKPDIFAGEIERLYPSLPKIELFSRRARPGWNVWGAEAEEMPANDLPATSDSGESLKSDLPPHDPDTGEIVDESAAESVTNPAPTDPAPPSIPAGNYDPGPIPASLDRRGEVPSEEPS